MYRQTVLNLLKMPFEGRKKKDMYSRRALNMNLPWLWKSYVSLSALNLLNSII